jgi:penicillin-binding protein 1A
LAGAALFFTYATDAPNITESDLASENSTQLLDSQGNVIWTMATQERDYANANEIPKTLKQAVVSIEDRRFYKHNGVDPIRIMGAALANIKGSSLGMQGGSTLTQQLVKLSVFSTSSADQTLKRKAKKLGLHYELKRILLKTKF